MSSTAECASNRAPIPGFPYALLVRSPLASLAVLAALVAYARLSQPYVDSTWFGMAFVTSLALVLLIAAAQLYAIPRAFYLLWRAPDESSQLHEASMLCGLLHLLFTLWLFWRLSSVY